jgi:hypothetical protein
MVACRLAESLASHGTRTLLVDAVLSTPELAGRYLGSPNQTDHGAGWGVASTLAWLEDPDGDHRVATAPPRVRHAFARFRGRDPTDRTGPLRRLTLPSAGRAKPATPP